MKQFVVAEKYFLWDGEGLGMVSPEYFDIDEVKQFVPVAEKYFMCKWVLEHVMFSLRTICAHDCFLSSLYGHSNKK